MTGRYRGWAAAGLAALLALAGCSADGGAGDGEAASGGGMAVEERPAEAPADEGGQADGGLAGGAVVDTRSIIYTGAITVRVAEVGEAARDATALAERYGGFVGADRRSASEDGAEATLVLRIPSADFAAAVADLAELGDEESREIETEDVTEEVVDLETRIATAEASAARTRTLLERAESIADVVAVEKELAEREAALASLQARQRQLADLTTLSTITVDLVSPTAPADQDGDTGFLTGLGAGWRALAGSAVVLVTALGALLPWLVAIGVPAGAVWWLRRHRTLRVAPGTPAPAQDPPSYTE